MSRLAMLSRTLRSLIAVCATAAALALPLLGGCSPSAAPPVLHAYTADASGFDTSSFFYDTGSEVVVFDAQFTPTEASKLLAAIRSQTDSPVTYVVVTHPNPDKFNGASVFQAEGAKVVASTATARAIPSVHAYKKAYFTQVTKQFTDASYPREARIDLTFDSHLSLPLADGARVELQVLQSPGVATTQTVAHIPALNALIVGDLVHHQVHAWLEGGIVGDRPRPDLAAWQRALTELSAYPGTTVFGGRGPSAPIETAVAAQSAYLTRMQDLTARYVLDLGARKSELADPQAAGAHYKAIAAQAQAAFPDRGLLYLIEYGVYGLVSSLAGL